MYRISKTTKALLAFTLGFIAFRAISFANLNVDPVADAEWTATFIQLFTSKSGGIIAISLAVVNLGILAVRDNFVKLSGRLKLSAVAAGSFLVTYLAYKQANPEISYLAVLTDAGVATSLSVAFREFRKYFILGRDEEKKAAKPPVDTKPAPGNPVN